MRSIKRRLKREFKDFILIWNIATLPFKLIYLFFDWLQSNKRLNADGYVLKRSESGKDQYEHREIAKHILGRRLEAWEVVHHINGRRNDNRPSNLCVMSRHDHDDYHKWYDWIRETYGKYPRRATQLQKLRKTFNGIILTDYENKKTRTG